MMCMLGGTCDDVRCGGTLVDTIVNFGEDLPEGNQNHWL